MQTLELLVQNSGTKAHQFQFPESIPTRPNVLKLSKWYAMEIFIIEEQINKLEQELGISSSCQKGCAACCMQLIVLNNADTLMLELAINNLGQHTKRKIKDTIMEQCQILTKNGFHNSSIPIPMSRPSQLEMQKKFFSLKLPCPLLDENGSCSVYSVRPSQCWSYRNYGSPSDCSTTPNPPAGIAFEDWERQLLHRLLQTKKPSLHANLTILQFALQSSL